MKELPLSFEKFYNVASDSGAATLSYWFEHSDELILKERGGIGMFVSLSGPEEFLAERSAKFMWDSFREEYYFEADRPSQISQNLKSSLKAAQKRLMELIKNEPSVSEQGVEVHMCAFVVHSDRVHMSIIGSPEVILIRDSKIIDLSEMIPVYDGIGYISELSVGSFDLQSRDIMAFSTPKLLESFLGVFDEKEVSEVFSGWSNFLEELEQFSENMVGNQYMWAVGHKVTPKADLKASGDAAAKGASPKLDNSNDIDEGKDVGPSESQSKSDQDDQTKPVDDKGLYTPGGIKGVSGKAGDTLTKLKSRIKSFKDGEKIEKAKLQLKNLDFNSTKRLVKSKISEFKLRGGKKKIFAGKPNVRGMKGVGGIKGFLARIPSKFAFVGAGVVVAIIVILLVMSWYTNRQLQAFIENKIVEIEGLVVEAEEVWASDGEEGEELVSEALDEIDKLEENDLTEDQDSKLADYETRAQSVYDGIHRIVPLTEESATIEIVMDAYLKIDESAEITDFALSGQDLYMVDMSTHAVYRYSLTNDSVEKVANSQDVLKEPYLISIGDTEMFVYDNKVGVVTMSIEEGAEQKWQPAPSLSARTIGAAVEMDAFGDNIYLLKQDGARVLRSVPAGAGYSFPEPYILLGSLDKGTDVLIDGNIYVLSNASEKVYKFYSGQQDNFTLSGFDEPLGYPKCGYTNLSDNRHLYVYDQQLNRIVVIEKATPERHPGTGVMLRQYRYRGERDDIFQDVREIVVDADENYMYVLDGTRVLKVILVHE